MANCGRSLFGGSSAQPNRTAPFFTSASWTFTAPSGTRISRLVAWRWGRYFGNGWRVTARQADGNVIGGPLFGETCNIPSGQLGCEFGSRTGVSGASRVQHDLDIALAKGRRILVDVTDGVSGVASGQILVRGSTKEPFRALPPR